jgi:hypothetical protein
MLILTLLVLSVVVFGLLALLAVGICAWAAEAIAALLFGLPVSGHSGRRAADALRHSKPCSPGQGASHVRLP